MDSREESMIWASSFMFTTSPLKKATILARIFKVKS